MAQFKTYKFADILKLQQFLNGGLHTGSDPRKGFDGIVGKTLVFTQPAAATVTFAAGSAKYNFLTFSEVKSQVEAAVAGIEVLQDGAELVFIETSPTNGVSITGGTAASLMGIKPNETSKVFKYPDGASAATVPHWVTTYPVDGYHVLITRE